MQKHNISDLTTIDYKLHTRIYDLFICVHPVPLILVTYAVVREEPLD